MRQDTESLVFDLTPPGVAVHCLYGTGVDTSESFQYSDKFPDVDPTVVYGDGDGTVNLRSAIQCGQWAGQQKQHVVLKELPGNEHVNMLSNLTTVTYILSVLDSPWCRQDRRELTNLAYLPEHWLPIYSPVCATLLKKTSVQLQKC